MRNCYFVGLGLKTNPADPRALARERMRVAFVLDCSCTMGESMQLCEPNELGEMRDITKQRFEVAQVSAAHELFLSPAMSV